MAADVDPDKDAGSITSKFAFFLIHRTCIGVPWDKTVQSCRFPISISKNFPKGAVSKPNIHDIRNKISLTVQSIPAIFCRTIKTTKLFTGSLAYMFTKSVMAEGRHFGKSIIRQTFSEMQVIATRSWNFAFLITHMVSFCTAIKLYLTFRYNSELSAATLAQRCAKHHSKQNCMREKLLRWIQHGRQPPSSLQ